MIKLFHCAKAGSRPKFPETIMNRPFIPLTIATCLLMTSHPSPAAEGVIAPGAKLETLASEFKFTEGPTSDAHGNVFFTDQPNNRIMEWSLDGKLSTFL